MSTHTATTTPTAATHSHHLGGLVAVLVIALVIVTVGYLTACWLFPFTTCHHRIGRFRGTGDAWQRARATRCPRCHGTGLRLRTGRRLIHRLRPTRHRR